LHDPVSASEVSVDAVRAILWNTLRVDRRRSCVGSFLKADSANPSDMTPDEKIRLGMLALGGASIVFASLGIKIGPLEIIGGFGTH